MKTSYLLLFILLATVKVTAQDFTNPKVLGDKAFRNKNYYEAAAYYKKAAEGLSLNKKAAIPYQSDQTRPNQKISAPDRAYVCYMLAESYRLYENYLEAEGWYYKVLNENFEPYYPLARLWYGVCLRANQHFDDAIKQLRQFDMGYKGDAKNIAIANKEISTCLFAIEQYKFPMLVDVVKMKGVFNSDGSDYSIVKRDQNYWFTSSRLVKDDKKHLNRIYAANNDKTEIISFKNDEKKDQLEYGTPSIDPTGKRMYLTRWYKQGSKTTYAIYLSNWQNGEWDTPKKLNSNVNADGYKAIQPFITDDGKRLFFVSDKPTGQGGDDIWVSDLNSEGEPINSSNLGKTINSPLDEQAPYYDLANKKLIYSSKGFLGLGGFDFFESFDNDGKWSNPVNMGYPINSAKDDLYFYPDKADANKFYITSDRQSECCLELFELHDQRYLFTGLVIDCSNHKALNNVRVSLLDSITKQTVNEQTVKQNGRFAFKINTRRPFSLVIEKQGYFTKITPIINTEKPSKDTLNSADICLQPFEVNKPIVLKNILYDFGTATLRPEAKTVLNELVAIMNNNPKIKIELSSHTDSIGSDAYNNKLSQQRAQACTDYVIAAGIAADRVFAKGYGKTRPVAPNSLPNGKDNPDGRQLNRRTEFTVLKIE